MEIKSITTCLDFRFYTFANVVFLYKQRRSWNTTPDAGKATCNLPKANATCSLQLAAGESMNPGAPEFLVQLAADGVDGIFAAEKLHDLLGIGVILRFEDTIVDVTGEHFHSTHLVVIQNFREKLGKLHLLGFDVIIHLVPDFAQLVGLA